MYLSKEWQRLLFSVLGGVAVCQSPVYASPKQKEREAYTESASARRRKNLSARSKQSVSSGTRKTTKHRQAGKKRKKALLPWLQENVYWVGGGILLVLGAVVAWKMLMASVRKPDASQAAGNSVPLVNALDLDLLHPVVEESSDRPEAGGPPQRRERTTEYWDRLREEEIKVEVYFRKNAETTSQHQPWLQLQKRRADKQASFAQRGRQFCQLPFFSGEVLEKPPHILYQTLHTLASERSCEIVEIYPSIKVALLKDMYSYALYLWDLQEGILVNPYAADSSLLADPVLTDEIVYHSGADHRAQSFFIGVPWGRIDIKVDNFRLSRAERGGGDMLIKPEFKLLYEEPRKTLRDILYGGSGKLYAWWEFRQETSEGRLVPSGSYELEYLWRTSNEGRYVFHLKEGAAELQISTLQLLPGKDGRPAFLLAQTKKSPPTLSLYDLKGKEVFSTPLAVEERKYKFVKAIFEPKTGYLRLYLSEEEGGIGELKERIYLLNRDRGKLSFQLGMEKTLLTGKDFKMLGPDKERRLYGSYVSAESADGEKRSSFVAPMGTIALLLSVSDRPEAPARKLDILPTQPSQEKYLGSRQEMEAAEASQGEESGGLDDDDDEAPQESEIEAQQGASKGLVTIDMGTKRFVLNRVVLEQKLPTFTPMEQFQGLAGQAGGDADIVLEESGGVTATNFELALRYLDGMDRRLTPEDAQSVVNVFSEYGQLDLVRQVCDEYSLPVPEMVEKDAALELALRYIKGEHDILTAENAQSVVDVLRAYKRPDLVVQVCDEYSLPVPEMVEEEADAKEDA